MIKDLRQIAAHYLKGWFVVDFALVAIDWLCLIIEASAGEQSVSGTNLAKMVRLLKATRLVRIYTMLKAEKVAQLEEVVMQKAASLGLASLYNLWRRLFQLVFLILWLNHLGACAWVSIQTIATIGQERNWERSVAEMHTDAEGFVFDAKQVDIGHLPPCPSPTPTVTMITVTRQLAPGKKLCLLSKVLLFFRTVSPVNMLSFKDLTLKTVMLISLLSAQCVQSLHYLNVKNMTKT